MRTRPFVFLLFCAVSCAFLAPESAHAFSGGFWKRRLTAPFWPKPNNDPAQDPKDPACIGASETLNDMLYEAVLFRHPDYPAANTWCLEIANQGFNGFAAAANSVVRSHEFDEEIDEGHDRAEIVGRFYSILFSRSVDPSGYAAYVTNTDLDYPAVLGSIVTSQEWQNRYADITGSNPAPSPSPSPTGGGACWPRLSATDETGSLREAGQVTKANHPEFFVASVTRDDAHNMMTYLLNVLRHNGHDAGRAVAHPDLPPTNSYRWGSDAAGVHHGSTWEIYDLFQAYPVPGNPQALDEGAGNAEVTDDLIAVGSGQDC
jgi:hypothetical protein